VFDDVRHAASLFACRLSATSIPDRQPDQRGAGRARRRARSGTAGLAVASGHAAQVIVMHNLMTPGDEFVASRKLYGGSINQFNHPSRISAGTGVGDPDDISSFEKAVSGKTKGDLHRVDRQSGRRHHRHRGGVQDCA